MTSLSIRYLEPVLLQIITTIAYMYRSIEVLCFLNKGEVPKCCYITQVSAAGTDPDSRSTTSHICMIIYIYTSLIQALISTVERKISAASPRLLCLNRVL